MAIFLRSSSYPLRERKMASGPAGAGGGGGGLQVLAQAQGEAPLNLGIGREKGQHGLAGHLGHPTTIDGCDRHGLPVAQQVQSTGEIVTALAIGNDTLLAAGLSLLAQLLARHFDEAFEQNMQSFALRTAPAILSE